MLHPLFVNTVLYSLLASLASGSQSTYTAAACQQGWEWSYNSLDQDPCLVAAFLQAPCADGTYTVVPLPKGMHYTGPINDLTTCACNTVVYSLMSACGACQNSEWASWPEWNQNCSSLDYTYPKAIPVGTSVPGWAFSFSTIATSNNSWNATSAQEDKGPESAGIASAAGSISNGPAISTGSAALSITSHSMPINGIVGAVLGAVGGILLGAAAISLYCYYRRDQPTSLWSCEDTYATIEPFTTLRPTSDSSDKDAGFDGTQPHRSTESALSQELMQRRQELSVQIRDCERQVEDIRACGPRSHGSASADADAIPPLAENEGAHQEHAVGMLHQQIDGMRQEIARLNVMLNEVPPPAYEASMAPNIRSAGPNKSG